MEDKTQELQPDEEVKHKRPVRIGVYWNKPAALTYTSNFGFGVNSYQPMIDYLDAKESGMSYNKKDIHLPLLEERCMDQYSAAKPFRMYQNSDIDKYIEKGDDIVRQIRQNDALGHGNVLNRTHTNWSMSKKWVQLVKKSHVIDYRKIREARLAEEERDAPTRRRANKKRAVVGQSRSRTPSHTRRGARSQTRSSRTPVRSRSGSVVPFGRNDGMVPTYDDVLSTLSHSKLDHELQMASRRERLDALDAQFEDVIEGLAHSLSKLNRRVNNVASTVYDNAKTRSDIMEATEDQLLQNKLRRRQELERISQSVDDMTSSRMGSQSNLLNYEVDDMNDRLSSLTHRQRDERGAEIDALSALTQAAAAYAARKRLSRSIDLENVDDADVQYLRQRNSGLKEKITVEKPRRRSNQPDASKFSDVQARVYHKASSMSSLSSVGRRINNKARYVNIYTPKPETGDQELVVKPSRTEINIDNMAKTFVERGKMSRRYAIDEEVDPPVSNLNTNVYNTYRSHDTQRTIEVVPSNSLRVRSAVIRARTRNTLLGH